MSTVLIVDDQPSVLQALSFVFESHNWRTLVASSGGAALDIAGLESVDAALVDLHMPGINGFRTCRELREVVAKTGRELPIWIMTAAFTSTAQQQGRRAGAIGVLKKPFDFDSLFADMEEYCSGKQLVPALLPSESAA